MTTTHINYGKIITSIQEDANSGKALIKTLKASELGGFVSGLECYTIRLNKNVLKKVVKLSESLGFHVTIQDDYGFEWESQIYCTK